MRQHPGHGHARILMNPFRNASLQLVIPRIDVDLIDLFKFFPLLSFNGMQESPFPGAIRFPFPDGFIKLFFLIFQGIVNAQAIFQRGEKISGHHPREPRQTY